MRSYICHSCLEAGYSLSRPLVTNPDYLLERIQSVTAPKSLIQQSMVSYKAPKQTVMGTYKAPLRTKNYTHMARFVLFIDSLGPYLLVAVWIGIAVKRAL